MSKHIYSIHDLFIVCLKLKILSGQKIMITKKQQENLEEITKRSMVKPFTQTGLIVSLCSVAIGYFNIPEFRQQTVEDSIKLTLMVTSVITTSGALTGLISDYVIRPSAKATLLCFYKGLNYIESKYKNQQ